MDSIEKINEKYHLLTKSEKIFADYIVSNSDKVIHSTMNELKEILNIGDATIIRLSKKLGFSGFTDLKISLAKDNIHTKKSTAETSPLLDDINKSLERTHQIVDKYLFEKVVYLINKSNNILIYGKGQSGMSAVDLEILLLSVGIFSKAIVDFDFQIQGTTGLNQDDLLIIFSLTGRTTELMDSIKIAKENNATIVAITNYLTSPIAKLADVVLQSSYDEFISSPVPGRISQMYISGVLTELYEEKYQDNNILSIREKALRAIIKKRIDE